MQIRIGNRYLHHKERKKQPVDEYAKIHNEYRENILISIVWVGVAPTHTESCSDYKEKGRNIDLETIRIFVKTRKNQPIIVSRVFRSEFYNDPNASHSMWGQKPEIKVLIDSKVWVYFFPFEYVIQVLKDFEYLPKIFQFHSPQYVYANTSFLLSW